MKVLTKKRRAEPAPSNFGQVSEPEMFARFKQDPRYPAFDPKATGQSRSTADPDPGFRIVDGSSTGPKALRLPQWKASRKPPTKPKNLDRRSREYPTGDEVAKLIAAAEDSRNGHRDAAMILICYRHGLRTKELVALRWDPVNLDEATLIVHRAKNGKKGNHDLSARELRAFRKLKRDQDPPSQFIFTTERGTPFTLRGFRRLIELLSAKADLGFPVHAHMLRHGTGYHFANKGRDTRWIQDFMGHKQIQNTVRYTELSPEALLHKGLLSIAS